MCNLYEIPQSRADMATHFGVLNPPAFDIPHETKRGERGIIIRGAADQRLMLEAKWGFPRPQKDRAGELLHHEPVNLIADLTNPMWQKMVPDPRYRCLIPVAAFAQPDGKRGAMTRTWFRAEDWSIFAWAGFCRNSEEWGPVYAAMTTDSNSTVAPLNPRMPVMLAPRIPTMAGRLSRRRDRVPVPATLPCREVGNRAHQGTLGAAPPRRIRRFALRQLLRHDRAPTRNGHVQSLHSA